MEEMLRWFNLMLGLLVLIPLVVLLVLRWRDYSGLGKTVNLTLLTYAVAVTEASGENLLLDAPIGLRTTFFVLANGGLLATLWLAHKGHETIGGVPMGTLYKEKK